MEVEAILLNPEVKVLLPIPLKFLTLINNLR